MSKHSRPRVSKVTSKPVQRGAASGTFPAAPARGLADALLEALEQLEKAKLATTHRDNPDDDDEDPTRRAGSPNRRD